MINEKQVDYIIDVRDHDEFAQGHIPSAVHLSKGWIEAKINQVVPSKDKTVILYCGGGNRSALAAENLVKMVTTHIYSLQGVYKGGWGINKLAKMVYV